jgi:hypothetical protein
MHRLRKDEGRKGGETIRRATLIKASKFSILNTIQSLDPLAYMMIRIWSLLRHPHIMYVTDTIDLLLQTPGIIKQDMMTGVRCLGIYMINTIKSLLRPMFIERQMSTWEGSLILHLVNYIEFPVHSPAAIERGMVAMIGRPVSIRC